MTSSATSSNATASLPWASPGFGDYRRSGRRGLYIDGKFHGNAPATRKLPAGPHAILLKSAGLSDSTRTVEVPAAGTLTLKGTLQKSNAAP